MEERMIPSQVEVYVLRISLFTTVYRRVVYDEIRSYTVVIYMYTVVYHVLLHLLQKPICSPTPAPLLVL